jgi:hypothetical protein
MSSGCVQCLEDVVLDIPASTSCRFWMYEKYVISLDITLKTLFAQPVIYN